MPEEKYKRPVTAPDTKAGALDRPSDPDIVKTHPAFGMVKFARVTGGHSRLFGSELDSNGFIRLTVCPGQEHWHLSRKWWMESTMTPLVEVDMTPAQFAELITTLNIGSGVPGTIRHINGQEVPDFADPDTLQAQIHGDIKQHTASIRRDLDDLRTRIVECGLGKGKREELLSDLDRVRRNVGANMPYILDQYTEAVEKVTASAKAEVESFVTHAVTQLGLDSLEQLTKVTDQKGLAQ